MLIKTLKTILNCDALTTLMEIDYHIFLKNIVYQNTYLRYTWYIKCITGISNF